ncbi:regulatory protein RecX [Oleiagrimonas sp. MCCC 1A03011]|uniref:regulatory protein RecX n=1 Tax=Oleiagrimonas sp. MCCC 1A03011 TaxID=1926883 RepID=UPI000DC2C9E3|nr:regulatory protein RecX [Oleiagrimonas sp. MCCC 1A03011]RAP57605.1 recombination regulator RecX [Oleiagrimonas sp. MCCC 1A03011]
MPLGRRKKTDKPRRSAYDKALALLARREQSRHELQERLLRDGYARDEAREALDHLAEDGYQDDARFAEMMVRSRILNGYGPRRIRAELRTHRIGDAQVERQLAEAEVDWLASARTQLHRRYGESPVSDYAERAKRAQFLLRRGFDAATVNSVTRADVDDAVDSED